MNSLRLDTFERANKLYAGLAPDVMVAIRAKRNLRIIKWGSIGAGLAVASYLWMVLPVDVSFVLLVISAIVGGITGLIWLAVSGIPKFSRWVRAQKYTLDRANEYGVRDE
jgi:hypothetical protein